MVINKKNLWETMPTTYEQLTPRKFRKHGHCVWFLIMLFIGLIDIAYKYYLKALGNPLSTICLFLIGISLPLFTGWGREKGLELSNQISTFVDLPKRQVENWLHAIIYASLTGSWVKWLSGIFVTIAGSSTILILERQNDVPLPWSVIVHLPLFFFCGVTAYSAIYALILPFQLGKLPIKVPLYQDNYVGVSSLNGPIFTLSITSLLFYGILYIAVIFGPGLENPSVLIWLGIIGLVVVVIFPNSVWALHKAMKNAKRSTLVKLSVRLEKSIQESVENPTQENLDLVKSLFEFRDEVARLPEWPIGIKTLLTATAAVVLSAIPTIVQLLWEH